MNTTFARASAAGPILLLDRTRELSEPDVLFAFALDELLCRQAGRGGPAVCHIWRHPRAFVMGVRDSRLPAAPAAEARLRSQGYDTAVRHSGGAAVPLDPGVVNLSLILPLGAAADQQDFHLDFEIMVNLIRHALRHTGLAVETGEIAGAYCPGAFDLSIGGRKFCGIAQRRQNKAFMVQAFVIAEGSGAERAQLVRSFYDEAAAEARPGDYPLVNPEATGSLQELAGLGPDAAAAFTAAVIQAVRDQQSGTAPAVLADAASRLVFPSAEEVRAAAAELRQRYVRA